MRVGLVVGAREARLKGQGSVATSGSAKLRLGPGDEVRISGDGDRIRLDGPRGGRFDVLTFRSLNRSRFLVVNGRAYRGKVEVFARRGKVYAVNVVGLEEYLPGVVAAEMGSRPASERAALEAQAIVSRTYALKNRGRFKVDGYDVRAGTSDQAYLGVERESKTAVAAVRRTRGQVLTYHGELISPFFHSTGGYSTAAPEESFRTVSPIPYLRPVSDRKSGGGYYCDVSPRFRWTVEWDGDQLEDILRRTVPRVLHIDVAALAGLHGVSVHTKGPSGRVTELRLSVKSGDIPVFGPDIRAVLQTPDGTPLGSTAIEVSADAADGKIRRLRVSGAGWGHGVGMCQWGAVGRARAGQSANTIVTTYFPGTRIENWY
ncbi:MAG: SpoIID/LytB domain-containing protein [Gemmatimonadales bacterium]